MKHEIKTKDGKKGGYLVGKPHSQGGIKGINVDTNEPIEVEGGEVIITKPAVKSNKTYEFEGKEMKPREILSEINSDHGGVEFKDGGQVGSKFFRGAELEIAQNWQSSDEPLVGFFLEDDNEIVFGKTINYQEEQPLNPKLDTFVALIDVPKNAQGGTTTYYKLPYNIFQNFDAVFFEQIMLLVEDSTFNDDVFMYAYLKQIGFEASFENYDKELYAQLRSQFQQYFESKQTYPYIPWTIESSLDSPTSIIMFKRTIPTKDNPYEDSLTMQFMAIGVAQNQKSLPLWHFNGFSSISNSTNSAVPIYYPDVYSWAFKQPFSYLHGKPCVSVNFEADSDGSEFDKNLYYINYIQEIGDEHPPKREYFAICFKYGILNSWNWHRFFYSEEMGRVGYIEDYKKFIEKRYGIGAFARQILVVGDMVNVRFKDFDFTNRQAKQYFGYSMFRSQHQLFDVRPTTENPIVELMDYQTFYKKLESKDPSRNNLNDLSIEILGFKTSIKDKKIIESIFFRPMVYSDTEIYEMPIEGFRQINYFRNRNHEKRRKELTSNMRSGKYDIAYYFDEGGVTGVKETIESIPSQKSEKETKSMGDTKDKEYYDTILESLKQEESQLEILRSMAQVSKQGNLMEVDRRLNEIYDLKMKYELESKTSLELLDSLKTIFDATKVESAQLSNKIAINGMPTELSDKQYERVRSQQFIEWFGDWVSAYFTQDYTNVSKVLNPRTDEPLVLYHGSDADFVNWRFDNFPAAYFGDNRSYSEWFAQARGGQGEIYEVFVSMKNPIDLRQYGVSEVPFKEVIDYLQNTYNLNPFDIVPMMKQLDEQQLEQLYQVNIKAWQFVRRGVPFLNYLKNETFYDGILMFEDNPDDVVNGIVNTTGSYVILYDYQVKWSTATNFNALLHDSRYEKGGRIEELKKKYNDDNFVF